MTDDAVKTHFVRIRPDSTEELDALSALAVHPPALMLALLNGRFLWER
jgi:hypothetical protein